MASSPFTTCLVCAPRQVHCAFSLMSKTPLPDLSSEQMELTDRKSPNTVAARFRRHKVAVASLGIIAVLGFAAIFAPIIAIQDPYTVDLDSIRQPPSADHILGTDSAGRDMWARMVYGARISMSVGFVANVISISIGVLIGTVSGYVGGRIDNILMRFTELVMNFPTFFAILMLVALLGPNIINVMVVIGVLGWEGLARLLRAQVLSLREQAFVEAARCIGTPHSRIVFRHILPNLQPYILVAATLGVAGTILTESALSFLGLGVQIPQASWGSMLNSAQSLTVLTNSPWLWLPPGIAISVAVLAMNFVGDGLRDAFDPRMEV